MKLDGVSILGYGRVNPAGQPVRAVNPATGAELEPDFFWATHADVDAAARLAARASHEYGRWPAKSRAGLLRRVAELIETNAPVLIERGNQETALPPARLQAEIGRTCGQLRLFATLVEQGWWVDARIDHGDPNRKPLPKPDVRSTLVPLGPVVVFSSSNFPFAFSVAGGDTASALAAGCPVILKPHQGHLGLSEMVGQLVTQAARECHAPEGVFSLLFGPGRDIGMALVRHPLVKAVGFTGSRAGGRALMDAAAARPEPIPVYAEMGSINPVFLLSAALAQSADSIATGLHGSVTLGVGQFCTNPGLIFLREGEEARGFIEKLRQLFVQSAPGTMLTPSICDEFRSGIEKFAGIEGVTKLCPRPSEPALNPNQVQPTLFSTDSRTFLANAVLLDEVFGPSTLLVRCGSEAQMFECIERLDGQLTATVHGTEADFAAAGELLARLRNKVGRLVCNGFPTGVEVCHAMNHGGPYPATADGRSTSVGTRAILRFARPVCFQNFPDAALPPELQESNPLGIARLVDGKLGR